MSKLFLSARITESFFTSEEIEIIKDELEEYNSKSEFIRAIIKGYLYNKYDKLKPNKNSNKTTAQKLKNIELLIKENQSLLKALKVGEINYQEVKEIYEGEEQEMQTNKVLNLIDEVY